MARIGTTTWIERNEHLLYRLKTEVDHREIQEPVILDFGPGCMVDFLKDYMPKGNRREWNLYHRLQRRFLKMIEISLRQSHCFNLSTTEPEEIARVLEEYSPQSIYVYDAEPRVINAVQRKVEQNDLLVPVYYQILDVTKDPVPQQGDIVIAYHVVERTPNPEKSLDNIARSVRVGGLLSVTTDWPLQDFERLNAGLYVKTSD